MGGFDRADVLVAGGGPAGLAAAIATRLAGFEVTLAEPKRPPIDKACGEGIMPDGALLLARMGVDLPPEAIFRFRGIEFLEGPIRARAAFRRGPGIGTRRTTLHSAMSRRAAQIGVRLLWGLSASVDPDGTARIDGETFHARWIVGADGAGSRIRRTLGLDTPHTYKRFGMRRHYAMAPWSDAVQVWWADRCEAYVTGVDPGTICLALLIHDPELRFEEALELFPGLKERLEPSASEGDEIAMGSTFRTVPRVTRGKVALLGDASGSVDALTGLGITLSLHQSVLLAGSLLGGSLEAYQSDHRALGRLARRMARLMLGIDRRPVLRRVTLQALETVPGLFPFMLRLHTRDLPFLDKGALKSRHGRYGAPGSDLLPPPPGAAASLGASS